MDASQPVAASRPRLKSSSKSSTCSKPHDTRTVPSPIPDAANSSGVRPTWVLVAEWQTSVSGPPREVAWRAIAVAFHEPLSGVDPSGQVKGQQPAHGSHLADGQVVLGMGGQPRIAHPGYGPVALE